MKDHSFSISKVIIREAVSKSFIKWLPLGPTGITGIIEITLRHGYSVNLPHIFRTPLDGCFWAPLILTFMAYK